MIRRYVAEGIGTFALVFCGTGAIVVDTWTGGALGVTGIALVFGLVVTAMIYAFGDVSGAHINPAVTLAFFLAGRSQGRRVVPYVLSQLAGAFAASLALRALFPDDATLGATLPAVDNTRAFALEVLLTFLLVLVILQVAHGSKETGTMAGIAVGATVGLEALFAGPVTGASMNPARSLAPALVSGSLDGLWIYLTAPLVGAVTAAWLWRSLRPGGHGLRSAAGERLP
ncbi:MAG: MIP family channel protein [Flavobacteriales bacterium]|nr:MIP family channel protein [Flavobacteriales bacterium]